uniref:RNA-directed DNA polymerase, eukaryota n=1 Tax=Tanacetum cinerariifolium TaxID=118510 RepID=A0A6L2P3E2_TANCI|nr:RNA-directed DNA polymerase, eukaryota [Tanacetum cinerariifolium]
MTTTLKSCLYYTTMIRDSGASFNATYCKEELERFNLRSGKTLKDVKYISSQNKRLIFVGQLDEEGYHVGFRDQQWKVTKGSLVVACGNKCESLYMVEVPFDRINKAINRRGNTALWPQRLGHMSSKGMKILASNSRILNLQKAIVGFCEPCVLEKKKAASLIGCAVMQNLFRYLGVMVGDSMSRKLAWADTVQKLRSGYPSGRLKLSLLEVSWDKVLASKKNGGLGVSSFHALNRVLLLKWVWHFLFKDGSLWYRVIQALYGASFELHPVNHPSIWCSILREMQVLISKGFDFVSYCKKRVGDGIILGSGMILGFLISHFVSDRWICDLNGDGVFLVREVRTILDDIFLPSAADATRWVKYSPIKINVFAWRARLDRLSTRSNLVRRGVVLDSSLCPLYGLVPEDIHHVLFRCDTAKFVFRRIWCWWDLD